MNNRNDESSPLMAIRGGKTAGITCRASPVASVDPQDDPQRRELTPPGRHLDRGNQVKERRGPHVGAGGAHGEEHDCGPFERQWVGSHPPGGRVPSRLQLSFPTWPPSRGSNRSKRLGTARPSPLCSRFVPSPLCSLPRNGDTKPKWDTRGI